MSENWPRNLRPLRRSAGPRPGYHGRWATSLPAQLRTQRGAVPCVVEDISASGARLHVGRAAVPSNHVFLLLENYGTLAARVAWRRSSRLGLHFAVRHPALLALAADPAMSGPSCD